MGPLKPPKKRPEPVDKTVPGMAAKHLGKEVKRERKVAEKADVDSHSPRVFGDGAAGSQLASNADPKQSQIESISSDTKTPNVVAKEEVEQVSKPIDQVQLVSKINKNLPMKPQPGLALKMNSGGHNKVGTLPPNGPQVSSREQPPTPGTSRELDSQSSSFGTLSAPSSPGKGPGSSRRLFTVVTPSVERKQDLKRQESTVSSKALGKRTSDTQSMKSEPGVRDAQPDDSTSGQAPPVKRPTTSHLSSRAPPGQKNTSSVGVTVLSSNVRKQAANGKASAPTVKVKPNTGVGVAKDDSSQAQVATAGSKQ